MPYKILHIVPGLYYKYGGTTYSSYSIVKNLSSIGLNVKLVTFLKTYTDEQYLNDSDLCVYIKSKNFLSYCFGFGIIKQLIKSKPDLVHYHGIWHPSLIFCWVYARLANKYIYVNPRGMLESWSLCQKKLKKKLYKRLFLSCILRTTNKIVVTSELEKASVLNEIPGADVLVLPNGVDSPETINSSANRKKIIVFMSRLHEKKGVELLIEAWSKLNNTEYKLIIAGDGDDVYKNKLISLVRHYKIESSVQFTGMLLGDCKSRLLNDTKYFVLPTFSENFGNSILEALSYGVPVITTKYTPWDSLVATKSGWVVDTKLEEIIVAISSATSLNDQEYELMSASARSLANSYSWREIASKLKSSYEKTLGTS